MSKVEKSVIWHYIVKASQMGGVVFIKRSANFVYRLLCCLSNAKKILGKKSMPLFKGSVYLQSTEVLLQIMFQHYYYHITYIIPRKYRSTLLLLQGIHVKCQRKCSMNVLYCIAILWRWIASSIHNRTLQANNYRNDRCTDPQLFINILHLFTKHKIMCIGCV